MLPSNCDCHGNLARTAAFACRWGEMKLIKGGIKWVMRIGRGETESTTAFKAIKENGLVSDLFSLSSECNVSSWSPGCVFEQTVHAASPFHVCPLFIHLDSYYLHIKGI